MERVCKKCKKPLSAYDKKNICQSCQTKKIDKLKKSFGVFGIVGGTVGTAYIVAKKLGIKI
ncbi:MAG: hypothetical protein J6O73_13795 [Lachnospiraceae bacterium]|nr:hypothetical protein [Lachnospiraceae bacterium]